jgi:heme-degrading monooxygenase HmoA
MYIAMNRFKVTPGSEEAFEQVWTGRDSHLRGVPGFVEFHLLKGPNKGDHTLYSSHTIWADHNRAMYLGHPEFEGFSVVQTVK